MNNYYSVRVGANPCNSDITDLVAAFLADAGFESFEPDATGVTAYIMENMGDAEALAREALADFPMETELSFESQFIKGEDWNSEWEKNYFQPILIDDECVIHSSFHTDVPKARYDIVIDPKMAFGTGHHDTTSQMVQHILHEDEAGKSVIDMGTGTGILAILAAMRGATDVVGIEIDAPAYENAVENARLNSVDVKMIHGDASALAGLQPADYLFANINRNIILGDIDRYAKALKQCGVMLLSGFYEEDVPMILEAAAKHGLSEAKRLVSNRWTALKLIKE
jgi:ribosomal protein L11 methyltransferase